MTIPDIKKARLSEVVAEADIKMVQGGDEELNLLNALVQIQIALKE